MKLVTKNILSNVIKVIKKLFDNKADKSYVAKIDSVKADKDYVDERFDSVPVVRSDWNQNDENSPEYIKNRICYEHPGFRDNIRIKFKCESELVGTVTSPNNELSGLISMYAGIDVKTNSITIIEDLSEKPVFSGSLKGQSPRPPSANIWIDNILSWSTSWRNIAGYPLSFYADSDFIPEVGKQYTILFNTIIVRKIDNKYLNVPGEVTERFGERFNLNVLDTNGMLCPNNNVASGSASHAEGESTTASGDIGSHAEGSRTTASGDIGSHAEGSRTTASGDASHAEGYSTTASGGSSHAEGIDTTASGDSSHAEGIDTTASGDYSHAEGKSTTASGESSHAEGGVIYRNGKAYYTIASGVYSHAEGGHTTASGEGSHAEGIDTTASGYYSHAEGIYTTASGDIGSHAEGSRTTASGYGSHAEGSNTTASSKCQHVQGKYNIDDPTNTYAHIVGNGKIDSSTGYNQVYSNAHTLDWDGNSWYQGDVLSGGTDMDDPNAISLKKLNEAALRKTQMPEIVDEVLKALPKWEWGSY